MVRASSYRRRDRLRFARLAGTLVRIPVGSLGALGRSPSSRLHRANVAPLTAAGSSGGNSRSAPSTKGALRVGGGVSFPDSLRWRGSHCRGLGCGSLRGPAFEPSLLFLISGLLIATLGLVGLGAVTMAVRVLPKWVGALVILGSPPFLLFVPSAFENLLAYEALHPLLSGVAWTLVGYALFRVPVRADPQ